MLKALLACCLMATPVAAHADERPRQPNSIHCLALEGEPRDQCLIAHLAALQAYWKEYPPQGRDRSNDSLADIRNEVEAKHAEIDYHRAKGRYEARRYLRGY